MNTYNHPLMRSDAVVGGMPAQRPATEQVQTTARVRPQPVGQPKREAPGPMNPTIKQGSQKNGKA